MSSTIDTSAYRTVEFVNYAKKGLNLSLGSSDDVMDTSSSTSGFPS